MMASTPASASASMLGAFIREQRQLARLSIREMSRLTSVSNAYLSQVERGLHEPSVRVLRALADALELPVEELVQRADTSTTSPGATARPGVGGTDAVETAIKREDRLTPAQKEALLAVYRGFLGKD